MRKRSLMETNPHLKDPKKFREDLILNVASSTSIETGEPTELIANRLRGRQATVVKRRNSRAG